MQVSAESGAPEGRKPFYRVLYIQVLFAIVAGAVIGHFWPDFGASLKPLGDAFINLVKMIIAPVIFITIVTGLAGMGDLRGVGSVAGKAFGYFFVFSTLALIVGMIVANVIQPGAGMNIDPSTLDPSTVANYTTKAAESSLTGFLMDIIPTTLVSAFTQGNILQVLFVAILFGIGCILVGEPARPVITLFEAAGTVIFRVVDILMKFAPVGAFGAFAFTIGKYGLGSLVNLGMLIGTFYLTSAIFILGILGAVARVNGFSVVRLIRYLKEEILLVLGTSSSESALPRLMEKMEKAGCARPVVGMVVPTGYSFNLDGTNIYMTMAALFIAQATNTELTIWEQLSLLLVAMLSSKGAAGVTGAGFITLAATLSVVPAVPVAGMAIILGIDRFMSECRSITNFIGNAVATVVVSRWENALDKDQLDAALSGKPMAEVAPTSSINAPAGLRLGETSAD